MMPVLMTYGPFNVYSFGLFLALSFVLSTFLVWKLGREDLKEEEYLDAYFMMMIVAILCARIVFIVSHADIFGFNILKYFLVRETPGLSLFGGLLGGFLYLWFWVKRNKANFYHIFDLFSLSIASSLFLAKIGELLGGAGFGRETDFILGVKIIGVSGRRHPVELYEAILMLVFSLVLWIIYQKIRRHRWSEGLVFYLFILFLAILIFLLEFLKVSPLYLYGLSIRQLVSGMAFLIVLKPVVKRVRIIRELRIKKNP